ncbi:MAG: hypothetical protein JW770_04525, partial [Actinobacteria bacterium]|nr:hypothetical protein [Actinomycetota bacterium]
MNEIQKCQECGRVIKEKEKEHAPYCKACDEKLDNMFDTIEDNILIFKELRDSEIKTLEKFEIDDIIDLFKRVYEKFRAGGSFDEDSIKVLVKLKEKFGLDEAKMGLPSIPGVKLSKKERLLRNN